MKKILIMCVLALGLLFGGCAGKARAAAEQVIKDNGLGNKAATVCYDLIYKKECPKGTLQHDIKILPYIWNPFESRFCFGLTDINATMPKGMYCYSRDFIK